VAADAEAWRSTHTLEQATRFGIFMLKAVLSGRGNELIDLTKVNLFR
jgi:pyruvate dehydrogenase (quinone)